MNRKTSSKISLKTDNLLPEPVKNYILKSSAKMTKNALVQPRRKAISKSTPTDLLRKAKNLTYTSRGKIHPPSLEKRSITIVVQTSLSKLFALFNIYNNLPCVLIRKILSLISLNRQNMMIIIHPYRVNR